MINRLEAQTLSISIMHHADSHVMRAVMLPSSGRLGCHLKEHKSGCSSGISPVYAEEMHNCFNTKRVSINTVLNICFSISRFLRPASTNTCWWWYGYYAFSSWKDPTSGRTFLRLISPVTTLDPCFLITKIENQKTNSSTLAAVIPRRGTCSYCTQLLHQFTMTSPYSI